MSLRAVLLLALCTLAPFASAASPPESVSVDVPTGHYRKGPDDDRDGIPAWVNFSMQPIVIHGSGEINASGAVYERRLFVDRNDQSRLIPVREVQVTLPSGGLRIGPDTDRDGIPSYVEILQESWTFPSDGSPPERSRASPMRVVVDHGDVPEADVSARPRACETTCVDVEVMTLVDGTEVRQSATVRVLHEASLDSSDGTWLRLEAGAFVDLGGRPIGTSHEVERKLA